MSAPFIILGLPRSRTAWLARFLTYGDHVCGHEELRHMRSLEDVIAWFSQPCIGTVETGAAPFWRLIEKLTPTARIVVIRRPVHEVVDSLMNTGLAFNEAQLAASMARMDRKLDQIAARLPCLSVTYDELATEAGCRAVFEHCLPYKWDQAHWQKWHGENVQCDLRAMARYTQACLPALTKLAKIAKHQILSGLMLRKPVDPAGMTFQEESFDQWERDGAKLFQDHCVQVGEAPDNWHNKNLPLMRRIYQSGAMQIMTARSNGRMFGYLMTLIAPSLVTENKLSAAHTTFFASPDAAGIGLKLQRAAIARLKERGVSEVAMQAGVRGSADRIASLYKRLGAANDGQLYRLQLEN